VRPPPSGFLAEMVAAARARVADARRRRPLVRPDVGVERPQRLLQALQRPPGEGLALIAEIKRASPSRGSIAPDIAAAVQAEVYAAAGADALSVLTEPMRFAGSLADLASAAAACALPALRKDFIVDPYQVREAAATGAAAVLLIAAALDDDALDGLLVECRVCGLDALVEVHDEGELERALLAGAELIGVNNRDLSTLAVDLATTERLAPRVPETVPVVSESGVTDAESAARVAAAGARAVLVGETLMRTPHDRLPGLVAALRSAGSTATGCRGVER